MYDRLKNFLSHFINLVVVLVLLATAGVYVLATSIIMTHVINDLRLDTYIELDTGCEVVLLILLLGWGPPWLMRRFRPTARYAGKL